MNGRFSVAAAVAAVLLAGPALAQSGHPAASSAPSARAWLIAVHDWETPYVVLASDYGGFLRDLVENGSKAAVYFHNGDKAGGAAWAATWSADAASRYQSLRSRAQALAGSTPPAPPPALAAEMSHHPEDLVVIRGLGEATHLIVTNVLGDEALVTGAIQAATRAAGGDQDAFAGLRSQLLLVEVAGLRGSRAQSSIILSLPNDPETDSSNAVVHYDDGLIAIIRAAAVGYGGAAPDRAATAATLRQVAGSIDADAAGMESHAATRLQQLQAMTGAPAGLMAEMRTFPQSGAAERQAATGFRTIADLIEKPGSTPDDWMKAISDDLAPAADALSALGDKRVALGQADAPH